ncbi:cytochrome O ubiquinol oxidase subunit IV [Klebsiella pneumoniae]|uniref:Cytochrome bo(3) ubiquinol oxidase subunit 4 n=2 Tax=Enterobacteriaceae TaxID=543 RepID=A0A377W5U4_KLEPN|nr:cytochrome O ubiquinol oxidase subunit IV [Klebsiella pneumoniae]
MSHSTDHSGASHGSVKSYMTGFILSIILTVIPFAMVMSGSASHAVILGTILVTAVVQIVVHLVYFLHMNSKSDEGWEPDRIYLHRNHHCDRGCRLHLDYVEPELQHDDALRAASMFKQYLQVTETRHYFLAT